MTGTAVRAGTQRWPRTGAGFPGAGQPASSWGFGAWGRMEAVGVWPTGAQTFAPLASWMTPPTQAGPHLAISPVLQGIP